MMVWRSLTAGWIVRRDLRTNSWRPDLVYLLGVKVSARPLTGVEIHLLGRSDRIAVLILT